jgi:hypothetical protein
MPTTVNLTDPRLGLAAAGYVADHGWAVLPCEPGGKRPLWGLSWEDASTDPEQVMEWWTLEPRANIGVACIGDLVVLDVDGAEGEHLLEELEARHGLLARTYEAVTGRGRHLYWHRPDGLVEGWRYGGLELKASGYVLAPPSVHPSGAWYYAQVSDEPRILLPPWLSATPRPEPELRPFTPLPELAPARLQAAGEAALAGELGKLMLHASGNGKVGAVTPAAPRAALRSRPAGSLTIRPIHWLWDQRVPLGKLTILAGLAGQGKSLLTCWLAARASRGELDGHLMGEPVPTLLVSAEDDPEDTILPRLLRTGADADLVRIVDVREPGAEGADPFTRTVALPSDTPAILEELRATKARLVILDPISGLLDAEVDNYKSQHVRRALGPIKMAAEELHVAVVLITHVLPKSQGTDALARLADSHAYSGLPRSMLVFGPNPEDEGGDRGAGKVLTLAKSNLADAGEHGLGFTILEGEGVEHRGQVGWSASIRLDGAVATTSADTLASSEERGKLREAAEFLRAELADGPQQAGTMQKAAAEVGISEGTLRRAREQVCRRPYKQGPGPWWWALRNPAHLAQDGHLPEPMRDAEGVQGAQGVHVVLQMFPEEGQDGPEDSSNG